MRVLVANEPRSYRETFGRVFRVLRPNVETIVVEPEVLDHEVLRFEPDVVICDRVTPVVTATVRSWLEMRVEYETLVVSSNDRVRRPHGREIDLDYLLAFIDENEKAPT